MAEVVGKIECNICESIVPLKTNNNNKAYWNCFCGTGQYLDNKATKVVLSKLSGDEQAVKVEVNNEKQEINIAEEKEAVGKTNCNMCGAGVFIKLKKSGRAFWDCSCGVKQHFTFAGTKTLLQNLNKDNENGNNTQQKKQNNAGKQSGAEQRTEQQPEREYHYL